MNDNGLGDTCPANNIICVAGLAVPDDPASNTVHPWIQFTGEVHANFIGPTNAQAGSASVTVTNAYFENTNLLGREIVGSSGAGSPTDYNNMLEFVFFQHPTLFGTGSVSVTIDGSFGQPAPVPTAPGDNTVTDQQLRLGASDTRFTGGFAYAHWLRPPGLLTGPVPMNAAGTSATGTYLTGTGNLQLHIDDALVLGGGDVMYFPTSIELVAQGSAIPEPTAAALGMLGIGCFALLRFCYFRQLARSRD